MLNSDRQDKRRTNPRIAWRRPAGLSVASGCLLGTVAAGLFLLATAWPNPRGASLVLVGAVGLSLLLYIFWRTPAPSARNPRQNKMQPESLNIKGHQRSAISHQRSAISDQRSATQELARGPFQPRAQGAVFGGERNYQWVGNTVFSVKGDADQVVYQVHPARHVMVCSNSTCATIHGFVDEKYCLECGSPVEPGDVPLLLYESRDSAAFASASLTVGRAAGPNVLLPLDYFSEQVGSELRYCLVVPRLAGMTMDRLERIDPSQALHWGAQLARGLDHLHSIGITYQGNAEITTIAVEGQRAWWADFRNCQVLPHGEQPAENDRVADLKTLAVLVFRWATGQTDLTAARDLQPGVRRAFEQILSISPPSTGEEMAVQFDSAIGPLGPPPSDLKFHVGQRSDVGMRREHNEDSMLTMQRRITWQSLDHPVGIFVVADGMGGYTGGEVASQLIVDILHKRAEAELSSEERENRPDPEGWVQQVIEEANETVFSRRKTLGTDMGSTMVMAYLIDNQATIGHVGDSRAYLIAPDGLRQLTTDHSLVERLVASGQLAPQEAQRHPQRNVIYKAMGDREDVEPDIKSHTFQPGQALLMCSDGLNGMLADERIFEIVSSSATPQDAVDGLIEAANHAGGDDNVTAILIQFTRR